MTNTAFLTARNHLPRRDPLVLDLDGNGITTTPINPAAPLLFDTDGDGVRTATGWLGAGEAIVVRDLNGNGLIDSGRELFGDATVLTHGPSAGHTAAHGFAALADLDSNADGRFDSADADFASVRLWLDANQDGISQPGELHTLAALGVASIDVAASVHNVDLGGGNVQTYSASFTRTSGQVGSAGTASLAGSLLLAGNSFYRQFTDDPATTPEAAALPGMHASGWVRDLQAASRGWHSKPFKNKSTKTPRHADSGLICLPKTLYRVRGTSLCGKARRLQARLRRGARRWFEANIGLSPHRTALSCYINMSDRNHSSH